LNWFWKYMEFIRRKTAALNGPPYDLISAPEPSTALSSPGAFKSPKAAEPTLGHEIRSGSELSGSSEISSASGVLQAYLPAEAFAGKEAFVTSASPGLVGSASCRKSREVYREIPPDKISSPPSTDLVEVAKVSTDLVEVAKASTDLVETANASTDPVEAAKGSTDLVEAAKGSRRRSAKKARGGRRRLRSAARAATFSGEAQEAREGSGASRAPARRGGVAKSGGLVVILSLALLLSGCHRKSAMEPADPALRALGRASIRVQAERMESPLGDAERAGGRGGAPNRLYVLNGIFEGRVSEALLAISASMGYGLSMTGPEAGDLIVTIGPKPEGATIVSLIKELNKRLARSGAVIGVDVVNRRLTLSAGDDR
jgi:hypothetical protein